MSNLTVIGGVVAAAIVAAIAFGVIVAAIAFGVTDEPSARRALSAQGFTDIEFTGCRAWMCSKDDWYHTGFKAKAANGQIVTGAVCSGVFFKGSTVRMD